MSTAPRPRLVGFMSLLMMVLGVLQVVSGIVFLVGRNDADILDALDSTSSDVTRIGVVAIVMGVASILIGGALRGGANWARLLVGIVALANVVSLVWAAFSYHQLHWYDVVWLPVNGPHHV